MKIKVLAIMGVMVSIVLTPDQLAARNVVVNNQRMNDAQLQYLDQLSCSYIADGNYWLDTSTGIWGYAGGGAQGYLSENCYTRRPSLSERGLLYREGDWLEAPADPSTSNIGTDSTGPRSTENISGKPEVEN